MSRIRQTFEKLAADGRKALIPFITAGFPRLDLTVPLMRALAGAGADVIELGVPFSDPMAEGPTIQRSSEKALANGMTLKKVLAAVAEFREQDAQTPVVLMGYANPIEAMGREAFAQAAREAGVDGVLVVDYPLEEAADFAAALRRRDLDPIFLLAPTSSPARYEQVAKAASGYVYYVSLKGVTGSARLDAEEVASRLPAIRA
ncbi:MAG: tryptophan synthase subunit alpha, partial [Zoogloeaceae bacterium]|nr:tryptophan synthase subunit alpha [Zoogloeaceae bacterium]